MVKKVLVVDDEFDDLSTMKSVLAGEGFSVFTATNGAQAMDQLKTDGFDLILIDIRMPTLSGYDLVRLLKERTNGKTRMMFVSIVPKQEVDLRGVDGFVQKPFSPKTLIAEVKKALK